MVKALELGHIVLNVSDIDASLEFYSKVCGLEVVTRNEERKIAFMSLGEQHHDLALIQRGGSDKADPSQPGLVHFAWRVADFPALQAAHAELTEAGIKLEPIQHNITNSLYIPDPDGHLVELFCDRWGEDGLEVLRTQGPLRKELDMETGEAVGDSQELLAVRD
jgi:catechol 2,3-dioxygenase